MNLSRLVADAAPALIEQYLATQPEESRAAARESLTTIVNAATDAMLDQERANEQLHKVRYILDAAVDLAAHGNVAPLDAVDTVHLMMKRAESLLEKDK